MGTRAIIEYIATTKADVSRYKRNYSFKEKIGRMLRMNFISTMQAEVILAAFDAAASQPDYLPGQSDVFTLLDIAEQLLEKDYSKCVHLRGYECPDDCLFDACDFLQ